MISRLIPLLLPALIGCGSPTPDLRDALTFLATFDAGLQADFAVGDPALYVAPNPRALDQAVPASPQGPLAVLAPEGRAGQALRFNTVWDPVVLFLARDNIAYSPTDWSGTFSFWLRVDPDTELAPGYSDPFLVSDKNWDDASLYVDFTEDDSPRHFRFAAFADKALWNPTNTPWDAIAPEDRPMIDIEEPPFSADAWTHVAMVFEGLNTGAGRVTGYLNGRPAGVLEGPDLTITWDLDHTAMLLGRHYTGMMDELAVFNRALSPSEIRLLYTEPASLLLETRP